jgi:phage terminase small subunit
MPVLKNPKHERFAQELAKGKTQVEAYAHAGYKPHDGNSFRLSGNERILARVSELLGRSAEKAEVTIDWLREQLAGDHKLARELGQASAAVSATNSIGKLYGLIVERKEVGRPGEFESMNADQLREYIDRQTAELGQSHPPAALTNGSGKPH